MGKYEVVKNVIIISGKRVDFEHNIEDVKEIEGIIVVLLDIGRGVRFYNNVFGLNQDGELLWQVQDPCEVYNVIPHGVPYVAIRINEAKQLLAYDFSGGIYFLNPNTGKIIGSDWTK